MAIIKIDDFLRFREVFDLETIKPLPPNQIIIKNTLLERNRPRKQEAQLRVIKKKWPLNGWVFFPNLPLKNHPRTNEVRMRGFCNKRSIPK